jgi:hypothetical protein
VYNKFISIKRGIKMLTTVNQDGAVLDDNLNELLNEKGEVTIIPKDQWDTYTIIDTNNAFGVEFDSYLNTFMLFYGGEEIPLETGDASDAYDNALAIVENWGK